LAALAVGACARQQQAYYVVDPNTGQPVPVVMQQQIAQPQYVQQTYAAQPQYAQDQRGLFSSSPAYAQQSYAEPAYQQPIAPPQAAANGERGLFTSSGIGGPFVPAPNVMGRGF
jgi:CubicO group peptidase (beta-lactamase class C family)